MYCQLTTTLHCVCTVNTILFNDTAVPNTVHLHCTMTIKTTYQKQMVLMNFMVAPWIYNIKTFIVQLN